MTDTMTGWHRRGCWAGVVCASLVSALGLVACSSVGLHRAPVEDRSSHAVSPPPSAPVKAPVVRQPPGAENAGKPGFYTIKPGDTLIRIALENGQSHQDIARWNHLDNPNRLEVGQVLRVAPPAAGDVVVRPVTKPVLAPAGTAASGSAGSASGAVPSAAPAKAAASSSTAAAAATSTAAAAAGTSTEADIVWVWPAGGTILAGFDDVKNKGLDISGTAGDPVLAAADGRVVYVGAGLRGYGNLIILKHNNVFLTAYAHNQTLLVKEDQSVQRGQKIATMGNSDADRVKLHFELRRQGKPVDPARFLPAR